MSSTPPRTGCVAPFSPPPNTQWWFSLDLPRARPCMGPLLPAGRTPGAPTFTGSPAWLTRFTCFPQKRQGRPRRCSIWLIVQSGRSLVGLKVPSLRPRRKNLTGAAQPLGLVPRCRPYPDPAPVQSEHRPALTAPPRRSSLVLSYKMECRRRAGLAPP